MRFAYSHLLLIFGEPAKALEILIDAGERYYQFREYQQFWPYENYSYGSYYSRVRQDKEFNTIKVYVIGSFARNLYTVMKSLNYDKGIDIVRKKLKVIERAEDYIEYQDTVTCMGIIGRMCRVKLNGYSVFCPSAEYDIIIRELEKCEEWYRKFEEGLLDNQFLHLSVECEGAGKEKFVKTIVEDFETDVAQFDEMKRCFYEKSDEELRKELEQVFINHGLLR